MQKITYVPALTRAPKAAPTLKLERRVPLSLVFAVALHFSGVIAWAAYLDARVAALEEGKGLTLALNEKFARLEERIDAVRADIARLRR